MTLFERVRHLFARGEVDDLDRGTQQIVGLLRERRAREENMASLRVSGGPPPRDLLRDAVERRNSARR
jgi:hypothetical protein